MKTVLIALVLIMVGGSANARPEWQHHRRDRSEIPGNRRINNPAPTYENPPMPGTLSMRVTNYGYYIELQMVNYSNIAVTCQGNLKYDYVGSTYGEMDKGIYAYLQPGQSHTESVTISPLLQLAYAHPEINCN